MKFRDKYKNLFYTNNTLVKKIAISGVNNLLPVPIVHFPYAFFYFYPVMPTE
jgi:hypothetical protein